MTKLIKYKFIGFGWLNFSISNNESHCEINASYLTNPLFGLANGLIELILKRSNEILITFAEEPGEYLLRIKSANNNELILEICYNSKLFDNNFNSKSIVYSDIDSINHFSKKFLFSIESLLSEMSMREYKLNWGFDFPEKAYDEFKKLVIERFWNN